MTGQAIGSSAPTPAAAASDGRRADSSSPLLGAIAATGLVVFAVFTVLLWAHLTIPFDAPIRDYLLQWSSWHDLWNDISQAANFPLIGIGVAIVAWLLWRRRRREAVLVVITLALVTAGSEGVKQLVHRDRPPKSDTVVPGVVYSYPSGHELEAVTIIGIVALLVWRSGAPRAVRIAVAVAAVLFCLAVAVARIAINAHWPSDVVASGFGGIGVLALVALLTADARGGDPAEVSPTREA